MDSKVKDALAALAGRQLSTQEVTDIDALLQARNDTAIATILSAGRTRLRSRLIGIGTILEVMGSDGALFLDALVAAGAGQDGQSRMLHWAMVLISNSNLDIGKQATQDQMTALATSMPIFAEGLAALKALGTEPDPIHYNSVSDALNKALGVMTI